MTRERGMAHERGFTLIEAIVGMLIASLVLAGAYSLWRTHQTEGMRLSRKIDLRNKLTLASKRLQRSVTLAGLGLSGAATLAKEDAVGSDTLTIFTNPEEAKASLLADADHRNPAIRVDAPALFAAGGYVALAGGGHAEMRRITSVSGSLLGLDSAFANDYPAAGTLAFPARRERYFSDQDSARLIHEIRQARHVVASDVKNFQVAFTDKHGNSTDAPRLVRTVRFSFTGIFPAREGAASSMVFSSTAIPRNTL
jgi:prepilin-type N-terminal cleavage/methylation domain-containing protein